MFAWPHRHLPPAPESALPFSFPSDHRYRIVACAFALQAIMVGSMFAYGVFFKPLEEELGWSRTWISACFSASFLAMGIGGVVAGRLSDRFGPRIVMSFAALFFAFGWMGMYFMQAPWQLLLFYGVLVGVGISAHDVVTLSTVARWFDKRRGLMTAVVKVGTACGQVVVPLLASALLLHFGWRNAALALGIIALIGLLSAAQGLKQRTQTPAAGSDAAAAPSTGVTFATARRSRAFWTLCGTQFCFIPCLGTIPVHIVPHAIDLGMDKITAATLLSVIGGCSIAGRLLVGFGADRIGGRRAMLACFVILLGALILLRLNEEPYWLFAVAAIYGISHGGFFTVVAPVIAEYFGTASHGAIFGAVLFFGTIGGAVGPVLAGRAFDTLGSYDIAFSSLAGLVFVGLMLVISLPREPVHQA